MADINLQRFVNINIAYHETSSIISSFDTVAYIETAGTDATYDSYAEVEDAAASSYSADFKLWAKVFFDNGGISIHHAKVTTVNAAAVKALDDKEIVVCIPTYSAAKTIADSLNSDTTVYGIKQKIIITDCNPADSIPTDEVSFLAAKYGAASYSATMAAYLCIIDFHEANSVQDYCYTEEDVTQTANDDTTLGSILTNNLNVNMKLAGKIVNLGGNMKDGHDLVNTYAMLAVQHLLTDRIINLLLTKIKGSIGLSEIQSVVADEMKYFLADGYLSTDKVWTDNDLKVSYGDKTYTIISKDEPLVLGYKFVTLPIQSLTEADKAARKAPPMYLVLADSYGIRTVTINGEVI